MKEKDDSIFNKSSSEDITILNASLLSKNQLLAKRNIIERHSYKKEVKKSNKVKRYSLGLFFFCSYILLNAIELIICITYEYNYELEPLSEIYLRLSSLLLIIFFSMLFSKIEKKKYMNSINIMRNYVPDWKEQNDIKTKSSLFYVYEGTTEKFNKMVHKISFFLMWVIFFALFFDFCSFKNTILLNKRLYMSNTSFPLFSILIIVILRKYFLHTAKFTLLAKSSAIMIIFGIICIFIYQFNIYDNLMSKPYIYGAIGGIFFGFFSTILKYQSNLYGENFKLSAVLGYIGIFTFTTIPFIICFYCIFFFDENSKVTLFSFGNNTTVYGFIFFINFLKFIFSIHCIIALSPLVFSMGLFINILINLAIEMIFSNLNFNFLYFLSVFFVLIGFLIGFIDKYLKSKYAREIIDSQLIK